MKRTWLGAAVTVLALVVTSSLAFAAPSEHLNWGAQLHSGSSSCPDGTLVVNVVQKVLNDRDSGVGGVWAYDDYVRQIRVVQTSTGFFCATVKYQGNFTTIAGTSPNASGTVGDGIVGTFEGGLVVTFTATLLADPGARTKGSIGTRDYECVGFVCPGYLDWTTLYFETSPGFAYSWWGWVYHAGNNGSWVNSDPNSGDITGD